MKNFLSSPVTHRKKNIQTCLILSLAKKINTKICLLTDQQNFVSFYTKKKVYTTTEPERRFEFEEDKLLLFFFVAFFSRTICDAMVMFMHFANLTLFRSCCCCYWNSLLHSLVVVLQLLYHQTFNNMLTLSPFSSTSLLSSLPCVLCVYRIRNCTFYFFEWKFNSSSSSSCYLLFD